MGLLAILAYSFLAFGEYRTFELNIENTEKGTSRTIQSTMDHIQYQTYYPLQKNEVVRLQDSWMCWDNMSHYKRPCAKPEGAPTLGGKPAL